MSEIVKRVADAILKDLTDRRGIRQAFDGIDDEVMAEIRDAIGRKAIAAMQELIEAIELTVRDLKIPGPPFCTLDTARAVYEAHCLLKEAKEPNG